MDTTFTDTPLEISDLRSGTDYLAQLALANPMAVANIMKNSVNGEPA